MADEAEVVSAPVTQPLEGEHVAPKTRPEVKERIRQLNEDSGGGPVDPIKEAVFSAIADIEARSAAPERDDKGRFLPKEPKESADENPEAKDAKEPVGEDRGQPVRAEEPEGDDLADEAKDDDAKAEPAADEPSAKEVVETKDSLDLDLVIRAAQLGVKKDKINSYSNKELKAVIENLEEREAAAPKVKDAPSTEPVAEAKKEDAAKPAREEFTEADYNGLVEDGHDERLVKMLKASHDEQKFLRDQMDRLTGQQKAPQPPSAEDNSRLNKEVDGWFDTKGGQFGKGSLDSFLAKNPDAPEAKARLAVAEMAAVIKAGLEAQKKPVPALADLLEMGHALVNPVDHKQVEKDAMRQVARTIQEKRKNKIVSRPAEVAASQPKAPESFDEILQGVIAEKVNNGKFRS